MRTAVGPETMQCSASFVRPFVEELARGQKLDDEAWKSLGLTGGSMLPIDQIYGALSSLIDQTRDPQLGLKAGTRMAIGDAGVIDYLMQTAATVGDAIAVALRYVVLINESMRWRLEQREPLAIVWLESAVAQPAAAEDFMLSSLLHTQAWLQRLEDLECWFVHGAPNDLQAYARVFGERRLRFGAEHSAFVFPREQLRKPLPGADPKLHAVVRELAEILLAEHASRATSFVERVRTVISAELATPSLSAAMVARRVQTSGRTLARKLAADGTSFYTLLDDARRLRSLQLMADDGRSLGEIAGATGFAHVASFHRAFRRWTGRTPAEFRMRASRMQ